MESQESKWSICVIYENRGMHFMFQLQRATNAHVRSICFDGKIAQTWFTEVTDKARQLPGSWNTDKLHAGGIVQTTGGNLLVLCRPTNYVCVVMEMSSGQIFSVRAANLPVRNDSVSTTSKLMATTALAALFDCNRVRDITIRIPFTTNAPVTFDAVKGTRQRDPLHPYAILRYLDQSPCTAFACTSAPWSPHRTTMKIAVVDQNYVDGSNSLWTADMPKTTAIDLSRFATFPDRALETHFQVPMTTAKRPDLVVSTMQQVILAHAMLSGPTGENNGDDLPGGELDIGEHEEELDELDLVIGHYEVDEDNLPLPEAL